MLVPTEATPFYLASRHACRRLSETVPEVKLLVLLREPGARAYSEYQMKKRSVCALCLSRKQGLDVVGGASGLSLQICMCLAAVCVCVCLDCI